MGACFNSLLSLSTHSGRGSNKSGSHTSLFFPFPFSLVFGVTCFCTSSCHGSRTASLSEVPIWYFQNGSPFFLSHCFLIPPRKQSDTKKKERQQRHTQKQRKMIQEKMQSDTRKKAKWHQEESKVTPRKKAIWHQERSQVAKKESKVTPVLLFLGAMLLSFLVSLCFLVADREPNAASWCPFAFFLGVPLLSTLGVTFLSFGVSRFYLGVAFASFLPPRCLLSWCHFAFFPGLTLLFLAALLLSIISVVTLLSFLVPLLSFLVSRRFLSWESLKAWLTFGYRSAT